jgi:hypothetical protein
VPATPPFAPCTSSARGAVLSSRNVWTADGVAFPELSYVTPRMSYSPSGASYAAESAAQVYGADVSSHTGYHVDVFLGRASKTTFWTPLPPVSAAAIVIVTTPLALAGGAVSIVAVGTLLSTWRAARTTGVAALPIVSAAVARRS